MAVHHICASIEGLLRLKNGMLGRVLAMNAAKARAELLELQKQGHKYIPSTNCKHFNPQEGCECSLYNEDGSKKEEINILNQFQ